MSRRRRLVYRNNQIAAILAGGSSVPALPAAFSAGQWSVTPGWRQLNVTINSLPDNGGSAIIDIEFNENDTTWISSAGVGDFVLAGRPNGEQVSLTIRAVNAIGAGEASDAKEAAPDSEAVALPGLLVHQGDSISDGYNRYVEPSASFIDPLLPIVNLAVGGSLFSEWLAAIDATVALFDTIPDGEPKIHAIMLGNGPPAVEDLQTYCDAIRRSSNNIKLMGVTYLPRADPFGNESARTTLNQFWRDNIGLYCDGVCDIVEEMPPELVTFPDSTADETLYPDGVHPSILVYLPMRPIYGAALSAMIEAFDNDATAPEIVRLAPLNGATTVQTEEFPFVARFSEHVKFTENVLIELYDGGDNLIESFDESDIGSAIAIHGVDLEITPSAPLGDGTSFYINIASGSIADIKGNAFAGIDNDSTWAFAVPAVPDMTADLKAVWDYENPSDLGEDSHGSNHLTNNNGVTQDSGVLSDSSCARFTTANSQTLSIADNDDIGYSGDFSFVTWFRDGITNGGLGAKGANAFNQSEWELTISNIGGSFRLAATVTNSAGQIRTVAPLDTLTNGNSYMGVLTYTASTRVITVSLNAGTRAQDTLPNSNPSRRSHPFVMGVMNSGANYANTKQDRTLFYKRALTEAEEAWLYNSGAGRTYAEILATGT